MPHLNKTIDIDKTNCNIILRRLSVDLGKALSTPYTSLVGKSTWSFHFNPLKITKVSETQDWFLCVSLSLSLSISQITWLHRYHARAKTTNLNHMSRFPTMGRTPKTNNFCAPEHYPLFLSTSCIILLSTTPCLKSQISASNVGSLSKDLMKCSGHWHR